MKVRYLLAVAAIVFACLATTAPGLAGSPEAPAADRATKQQDASQAAQAETATPSRHQLRPLHRQPHAAGGNQTDADRIYESRTHRFADEPPADWVQSGTLHYGHGPEGLSNDVPTIGLSDKH